MSLTIGQSIASLRATRAMSSHTDILSRIYERLSTGLRIVRASDDAAGLTITTGLSADVRVLNQGVRNLNDGISLMNIADSALNELADIVVRITELAEQASSGTLGLEQRRALDNEAQALGAEYFRISRSTTYNGIRLFDGSISALTLQGGYGLSGASTLDLGGVMGSGTFGAATSYQTQSYGSSGVALGDVNYDGILDLVSCGWDDLFNDYFTVQLGRGDGTFSTETSFAVSATNGNIQLADMNADGLLDVVIGSGPVSIALGRGDGSFQGATTYQMEWSPSFVSVGDLNNDGNLDLVTAGRIAIGDSGVTVRLGLGSGTFGVATSYTYPENSFHNAVTLGDLNGDGFLDMVVAASSDLGTGRAIVRLGQGDGSFGSSTSYAAESSDSDAVTLGDLNGDSILDLVTAGRSASGDGYASVRLGIGDGTFGAIRSYMSESNTSVELSLGDINGDGVLDLVTSGYSDANAGYVTARLGLGDGTFGAATSYTAETGYTRTLALGDLNRDGVLDIVSAGRTPANDGYATVRLGLTRQGVAPLLPFSLTTSADAKWALELMKQKLSHLYNQRSIVGAGLSRTEIAVSSLKSLSESYSAASGRIMEVDIAEEAAALVSRAILQKAAMAVLTHAQQQSALVLQLLNA